MNPQSLISKLSNSFSNCLTIDGGGDVVRCEHTYQGHPRSVYFFQAPAALPSDAELSRIHEKIVSPSYFKTQDASRWSHYVVFVADDSKRDDPAFVKRQQNLEDDKDYARKFVVFESDLDNFLDRSVVPPSDKSTEPSVLQIWTQALQAAGLAEIQSYGPRAPVIRSIRTGHLTPQAILTPKPDGAPSQDERRKPQFIETFKLERFDDRKVCGVFQFSRVNLISGPNGSGKTSLLEAIEHYFCGATFRSDGRTDEFRGSVAFRGSSPRPFKELPSSQYQERDLRWYGRSNRRGNQLWQGFARFNFLNTDAAVAFSATSDLRNLKELLAKVALGPDASHTWNRMGEFERDIASEMPTLESTIRNLERSTSAATARLAALQSASPQAENQLGTVNKALRVLDWEPRPPGSNGPDAAWFEQFNSLRAFYAASKRTVVRTTLAELRAALADQARDLEHIRTLKSNARSAQTAEKQQRERQASYQTRLTQLKRLGEYTAAGFPALQRQEAENSAALVDIARQVVPLGELDALAQIDVSGDALKKPLGAVTSALIQRLTVARDIVDSNNRTRLDLESSLRATEAIRVELARLGRQFAESSPQADSCPLCNTRMEMNELLIRIDRITQGALSNGELQSALKAIADSSAEVRSVSAALRTIDRLQATMNQGADAHTSSLIDQARRTQERAEVLKSKATQLRAQLTTLGSAGFNSSEYAALTSVLIAPADVPTFEQGATSEILTRLEIDAKGEGGVLEEDAASIRRSTAEIASQSATILGKYRPAAEDLSALETKITEESESLRAVSEAFASFPMRVRERFKDEFPKLVAAADVCNATLEDLNAQLQKERARNAESVALRSQLKHEETSLTQQRQERQRLSQALTVLRDLQTKHSLETGLASFFASNLETVQRIFSKIHVPHELRISNLADCSLERVGNKRRIDLTQISTGQRAALMLSVFMTLNLSLRSGPPLMIIDDPIAHIDDLNALSFLDFLADVAESAQRQIFFSTANEKLANLFRKKMEFLASEFMPLDMTRFPGVN